MRISWDSAALRYFEGVDLWLAEQAATSGIGRVGLSVRFSDGAMLSRVHGRGDGNAEPDPRPPLFRVGSLSKALAVATLLTVAQRRQIDPDVTLREIFPELDISSASPLAMTTLVDLAGHRSTLARIETPVLRNDEGRYRSPVRRMDGATLLRRIARGRINGMGLGRQVFDYSDFGIALIGLALERMTGCSCATLAVRNVLRPHRIDGFHPSLAGAGASVRSRLLRGHAAPGRAIAAPQPGGLGALDPPMGAVATIDGLTHLFDALLTGRLLSPRHTTMVRTTRTVFGPSERGYRYGLGVARFPVGALEDGDACLGHQCVFEGFCGFAAYHPRSGITVSIMANSYAGAPGGASLTRELNPSGFVRRIFQDLAASILSGEPAGLRFSGNSSPLWR